MLPLRDYLAASRRVNRTAGVIIGLMFAAVIAELVVMSALLPKDAPGRPRGQPPPWEEQVVIWSGMAMVLATFCAGAFAIARFVPQPKDVPELRCPHCGRAYQRSEVLVATGKCPACLKHVLKREPDDSFNHVPLLSLAQLRTAKRSIQRVLHWGVLPMFCSILALLLFEIAWFYLLVPLGDLGKTIGLGLGWLAACVAGGLVLTSAWNLYRGSVLCPHCREVIASLSTVIASGCCPRCGTAIVRDATPLSEYRPLPKVEEVQRAARRFNGRMAMWMLLTFAATSLITAAMMYATKRILPESQIDWQTNVLRVLIFGAGFTLISLLLTAWLRHYRRAPELLCWNCRGRIDESSALLRCTGNCPHCGQRAVKDA